jgi:hypothetical protein
MLRSVFRERPEVAVSANADDSLNSGVFSTLLRQRVGWFIAHLAPVVKWRGTRLCRPGRSISISSRENPI